jgi:hypothetical protein
MVPNRHAGGLGRARPIHDVHSGASGQMGPSHKYVLAWVLAAGRQPNRREKMSTGVFRNKVFRDKVRSVTKTATRLQRTPEQQYSVIEQLLEVRTGAGCQGGA